MLLSMRIWDLPVRLFHWLFAALLVAAFVAAGTRHWGWHVRIGEAILVLAVWRVLWGFAGSETARWGMFARSPLEGLDGAGDRTGHAMAGGWLVPVTLGLIGVQTLLGLFAAPAGPLAHLAGAAMAARLAGLHRMNAGLVGLAIVLHLGCVVLHAARRRTDPMRMMVSGKMRMPAAMRAPRLAGAGLAALVLACAAGAVLLVLRALA